MRSLLSILAKTVVIFSAILFVATTALALLIFNLERGAFNPDTYKQAFANQALYTRLPKIMGQALATSTSLNPCNDNPIACGARERSPEAQACLESALGQEAYQALAGNKRKPTEAELQSAQACLKQYGYEQTGKQGGPPSFLQNLSAGEWESIISALLPPEELRALSDQTLDAVFAYLNGEVDSAQLSLIPLKQRLAGPNGMEVVQQMLNAQPPCTLDQLAQMVGAALTEQEVSMCKPPEEAMSLLTPFIETQLQAATQSIPDGVTLISASANGVASDPRRILNNLRWTARLSPLVPLAFLLGITLFAVRTLRGWLKWWGIPFIISGIITLGNPIAIQSLILTGIGLAMILAAAVMPRKQADTG
jgi:hypothetical protein